MKVFERIDTLNEKYLEFLRGMCRLEGDSNDKNSVNEVNDFIEKFAKEEGFSTTRYPFEKAGDYMCVDINEGAEKGYLFIAHTDTVFEKGTFSDEVLKEDDEYIYAPGIIDCKGGIAIALMAMKALFLEGYKKHLRLIIVSDEEIDNAMAGKQGVDTIIECSKGFVGGFCCEVGVNDEIVISRAGVSRYEVKVLGKSAHSGINYFDGVNAIYEAAKKIDAIQSLSEKGGITYSCNIIEAGTKFNIIPDVCTFKVDIRTKTPAQSDVVAENMKRIADTDYIGGSGCNLTLISSRMPMEKNEGNIALFEKIKEISAKYSLENFKMIESGGGADCAYSTVAGVPTVCGIGMTGTGCHTVNEKGEKASLPRRAKILAAVISEG